MLQAKFHALHVSLSQVKFIDVCDMQISNRGQGKGAAVSGNEYATSNLVAEVSEEGLLISC